jgi:hypothetical protein
MTAILGKNDSSIHWLGLPNILDHAVCRRFKECTWGDRGGKENKNKTFGNPSYMYISMWNFTCISLYESSMAARRWVGASHNRKDSTTNRLGLVSRMSKQSFHFSIQIDTRIWQKESYYQWVLYSDRWFWRIQLCIVPRDVPSASDESRR